MSAPLDRAGVPLTPGTYVNAGPGGTGSVVGPGSTPGTVEVRGVAGSHDFQPGDLRVQTLPAHLLRRPL